MKNKIYLHNNLLWLNHLYGSRTMIQSTTVQVYQSSSTRVLVQTITGKRQAMYYNVNIEAQSCNHCCRGKTINIKYYECVFAALVIHMEIASFLRRIMSPVACPALPYFSTLSHKRHDFQKKIIEHKMRFSIFSTTYVWNISYFKNDSARCYHKCT
jgi:hypothetical protein